MRYWCKKLFDIFHLFCCYLFQWTMNFLSVPRGNLFFLFVCHSFSLCHPAEIFLVQTLLFPPLPQVVFNVPICTWLFTCLTEALSTILFFFHNLSRSRRLLWATIFMKWFGFYSLWNSGHTLYRILVTSFIYVILFSLLRSQKNCNTKHYLFICF